MLQDDLYSLPLGAVKLSFDKYLFRVWVPYCTKVGLKAFLPQGEVVLPMQAESGGYFSLTLPGVQPGLRYAYVLDDAKVRPDPAAHFQSDDVHGPSCVVDPDAYCWKDKQWQGIALQDMVFYEVHTGTFTSEGTFDGVRSKLPYIKKLGINCLEIMPIAQFPGKRNWGYDGVALYAVQNSYGGPSAFKQLVDACHNNGIAVCLDVVYNHLGPEGNYLNDYGPYFTKKYQTPWGEAFNFDGADSDHVRRFIIGNALYWVVDFHIDALRLDAVHEIYDFSAKHILQELKAVIGNAALTCGRQVSVIAESDLNDARLIRPIKQGGYGLSGQWNDDFHHSIHAYLTGETNGYYADFGACGDIAKALKEGFVYEGRYSSFRKRQHGNSVKGVAPEKLINCIQNHDQVGNRAFGDRLSALVGFDKQKLAAALLLLAPGTPLIFMGQEFSEPAPFLYFIDHSDVDLIRAVQEGRIKEFALSGNKAIPDSKAKKTFLDSVLTWNLIKGSPGYYLHHLYRDLICLRKTHLPRQRLVKVECDKKKCLLSFTYTGKSSSNLFVCLSFLETSQSTKIPFGFKQYSELLHTADKNYGGALAPNRPQTSSILIFPGCGAIVGRGHR